MGLGVLGMVGADAQFIELGRSFGVEGNSARDENRPSLEISILAASRSSSVVPREVLEAISVASGMPSALAALPSSEMVGTLLPFSICPSIARLMWRT